jgi:hypothetical protein
VLTRSHPLDDQQSRAGTHGGSAAAQDRERGLVGPVVQDLLEHVGVGAAGHRGEEVAGLHAQPAGRLAERLGHVEGHALELGLGVQDRGEQRAVAAADVDDRPEAGEIARDLLDPALKAEHRLHS